MNTLKTGVVGVGYLGRFHAQKFKKIKEANLIGIYDLDWNRTKTIADEVCTQPYEDMKSLYNNIEAVSIVTPTSCHFEIAQSALKNNLHVFIEKPIAITSVEAQTLCTLSKKHNKLLQVGHIERFNPVFHSIREKLNFCFKFHFKRFTSFKKRALDVDVVTDLMIHDIDLLLNLLNESPISVQAEGEKIRTDKYDKVIVNLLFTNEKKAILEASRVHTHPYRMMIAESDSFSISADFLKSAYSIKHIENEEFYYTLPKEDSLFEELSSFVNSILNNKPSVCTGESATENLKIVERILESIDSCC